jgi:hypothetical protein
MFRAEAIRLSRRAAASLDQLEASPASSARSVARRVQALKPLLLADCLHGEVVRKSSIPSPLRDRYEIENLYVEDLPSFWRLLYSVVKIDAARFILVLEIVDHRTYSRWFPGRRR